MRERKTKLTKMAKIRKLLADKGWSVSELARRVDADQRRVDRFIKSRTLSEAVLLGLRISRVLQVPPEWLFDDAHGFPVPRSEVQEIAGPQLKILLEALEQAIRQIRESDPPSGR